MPTRANLNYFFTAESSHMDNNKQSTECRGFFSKTLDFVLLEVGEPAQLVLSGCGSSKAEHLLSLGAHTP